MASFYWIAVWFVESRQISFRIRRRETGEVGDYRGIFKEVRGDIRSRKQPQQPEKVSAVV